MALLTLSMHDTVAKEEPAVTPCHSSAAAIELSESWKQLNELSHGLFLHMDMANFLKQMCFTPSAKSKNTRVLRVNEPARYNSRCSECAWGVFDVSFSASTLEINSIKCASPVCSADAYMDWPSGCVRPVCDKPVHTKAKCTNADPTTQQPRKRGRPKGSKNKKGTKKSRALAERCARELEHTAQLMTD